MRNGGWGGGGVFVTVLCEGVCASCPPVTSVLSVRFVHNQFRNMNPLVDFCSFMKRARRPAYLVTTWPCWSHEWTPIEAQPHPLILWTGRSKLRLVYS